MPAAPLLDDDEIARRLAGMPAWRLEGGRSEGGRSEGGRLVRTVTTRDFRSAVELVARIAEPADEQNHHPDVAIHWNEMTLSLWTHASGGVTERDFRLVASIDEVLARVG